MKNLFTGSNCPQVTIPLGNDALRSDGETLELFLEFIENDIFHPDLAKTKYRLNLTIYGRK